ncbi:YbaB/EbfC family nucleoid-associated protein [Actinomycetes bacterium KLBMP 9797]
MDQLPAVDIDRTDLDALERDVRAMRDALNDTTGTAESPDGLIHATVSGRGQLLELKLDPRIYRSQDGAALAGDIVDAIRRATEDAQRRVVAAVGPRLLPPDVPVELVDVEFDSFFQHLTRLMGGNAGDRQPWRR